MPVSASLRNFTGSLALHLHLAGYSEYYRSINRYLCKTPKPSISPPTQRPVSDIYRAQNVRFGHRSGMLCLSSYDMPVKPFHHLTPLGNARFSYSCPIGHEYENRLETCPLTGIWKESVKKIFVKAVKKGEPSTEV